MKIRHVVLALLTLLFSNAHVSHAEGPKIWFENDGGMGRDFVTDGKTTLRPDFFGGFDVAGLVKSDPAALDSAQKYLHYNTYSHLAYWIGVIPSAGVFGYMAGSQNETGIYIAAGALLVTGLITSHFVSESRHYMHEAINRYNGVPSAAPRNTATPPSREFNFGVVPTHEGANLLLSLNF